jgi:hypothetical protein
MTEIRRPFPQFNAFRSFVLSELTRRKQQSFVTPVSPFVRMTSCLVEPNLQYAFFTLGFHGLDLGDGLNIFDESHGQHRNIVGYAYDMKNRRNGRMSKILISTENLSMDDFTNIPNLKLSQAQTTGLLADRADTNKTLETAFANNAHPIPGITDVSVDIQGLGLPVTAHVEWKCYNQAQLEYLRNHFMTVGNSVVLEWGNQFADKPLQQVVDFADDATTRKQLVNCVNQGRTYIYDTFVAPNDGNYNVLVGRVGPFQAEVDARTNIYTVRTTIVGVGEQFFGINTDTTFVRIADAGSSQETAISTIADFFKVGANFDILVNQKATDTTLVVSDGANWSKTSKNVNQKATDLKNVSFNPEDYRFISWKFFCKILLPEVIGLINHPSAVSDLPSLLDFLPDDTSLEDDEKEWVGCNPFLRSCEPDTMIVVTSGMKDVHARFVNAGNLDDPQNPHRGQLSRGVWLNVGMVRECFATAMSLNSALTGLLIRMSNAVAGFWSLRLFYDEDVGKYRVIDEKYTENLTLPRFWKFNNGTRGECLSIKLDAAFPPEMISQMMMYARYKSETAAKQKELMATLPMIGTTSAFAIAVNYTTLIDFLQQDIDAKNKNTVLQPLSLIAARTTQDADNQRQAAKVTNTPDLSTGMVADGKTPTPGTKLSVPIPKLSDVAAGRDATSTDNAIRNVPKPPAPPKNVKNVESNSLSTLEPAFSDSVSKLISDVHALNQGYAVRVDETFRSQDRQNYLFTKGRTAQGTQAVTSTARSLHTLGKAADITILQNGQDVTRDFYPTLFRMSQAPDSGFETIGKFSTKDGHIIEDYGHIQEKGSQALMRDPSAFEAAKIGSSASSIDATAPLSYDNAYEAPDTSSDVATTFADFNTRFGNEIIGLIELTRSSLINKLTRDGYSRYPTPNGFIFAFPTTATATVDLVGISGISISDGFFVDKMPFIFERHGVFQTTQISERVTEKGWVTTLRGVFKMMWLDNTGNHPDPITNLPPATSV